MNSRIVISTSSNNEKKLLNHLDQSSLPYIKIGKVKSDDFIITQKFSLNLASMKDKWLNKLNHISNWHIISHDIIYDTEIKFFDKMPTYEYYCKNCEIKFDVKQSFDSKPIAKCEECNNECQRQFSVVPVVFKGSGCM